MIMWYKWGLLSLLGPGGFILNLIMGNVEVEKRRIFLRGYGGKQETVGAMQKPPCFTEIWTQGKKRSAIVKIVFHAL